MIQNKPIFILDTNFQLSGFKSLSLFEKMGKDKVHIITGKKLKDKAINESDFFTRVSIEKAKMARESLNLREILKIVSRVGVNRLLVEGGAKVWTSFLKTGFFDEIIMFTGNKIMNDTAISCFNDFLPIDTRLGDFPNLTLTSLLKWKDNIEAKWIANS